MRNKAKRALAALASVLAAVFVVTLMGCGNPSSNSATPFAPSGLKQADVIGYWIMQGSGDTSFDTLIKKGMFQSIYFDENGGLKLTARVQDATVDREGTYKIDGGKLTISIPGMQGSSGAISAKAIDNAEVTIEGDTLKTNAIASDGSETVAKKTSDEQYQKYVEQCVALGPKKTGVGETVTTDAATFTVNSLSYVDEIYPSDTSGYYTYQTHQDGKSYLCATVTYTNNGTDYANPGYSTQANFSVAGNNYSAEVEVDAGSRFGKSYSVDAKDTATLYIYAAIPDSVKDTGETKLTWSLPKDPSKGHSYYSKSDSHDEFVFTL